MDPETLRALGRDGERDIASVVRAVREGTVRFEDLVLPTEGKAYWEGAALVLRELRDDIPPPVVPLLLEWLLDSNWPGHDVILQVLRHQTRRVVFKPLMEMIAAEATAGDQDAVENLVDLLKALPAGDPE